MVVVPVDQDKAGMEAALAAEDTLDILDTVEVLQQDIGEV